ncbi:MAG: hypothetical protein JWO89_3442 [Verrucomicrobiaceae bacterium]|nr:hypothetical protein [Verrucomicrobiaceae bacterium]MDB6119354.1 hypothetical protein [Verrucomicrobiaceae bacterium]
MFSSLAFGVVCLSLTSCVDLDTPTYGPPPVARPQSVFGPDNSPSSYYTGGGFGRAGREKPAEFGHPTIYTNGLEQGRHDRQDRLSPSYQRHEERYEHSTEVEFARGYNDGYNGR